jgi:hypothetical protein
MPAGFMSYIVKVIPIYFGLLPVTTAIWLTSFDLIVLNMVHQIMAYVSSTHNNLD